MLCEAEASIRVEQLHKVSLSPAWESPVDRRVFHKALNLGPTLPVNDESEGRPPFVTCSQSTCSPVEGSTQVVFVAFSNYNSLLLPLSEPVEMRYRRQIQTLFFFVHILFDSRFTLRSYSLLLLVACSLLAIFPFDCCM